MVEMPAIAMATVAFSHQTSVKVMHAPNRLIDISDHVFPIQYSHCAYHIRYVRRIAVRKYGYLH